MNHVEPSATGMNDYPPGHPAGTDEFVSAGEVISGHGLGTGGALESHPRATAAPRYPADGTVPVAAFSGPTVLLAVDGNSMSEHLVRTAHRLFGESAQYLAVNVGPGPYTRVSWSYVWPVAGPSTWMPSTGTETVVTHETSSDQAAAVITDGGLTEVTPIGRDGDGTATVIRAAHEHHADVVVISADWRNWFTKFMDGSMERELLARADFAILVVSADTPVVEA